MSLVQNDVRQVSVATATMVEKFGYDCRFLRNCFSIIEKQSGEVIGWVGKNSIAMCEGERYLAWNKNRNFMGYFPSAISAWGDILKHA